MGKVLCSKKENSIEPFPQLLISQKIARMYPVDSDTRRNDAPSTKITDVGWILFYYLADILYA